MWWMFVAAAAELVQGGSAWALAEGATVRLELRDGESMVWLGTGPVDVFDADHDAWGTLHPKELWTALGAGAYTIRIRQRQEVWGFRIRNAVDASPRLSAVEWTFERGPGPLPSLYVPVDIRERRTWMEVDLTRTSPSKTVTIAAGWTADRPHLPLYLSAGHSTAPTTPELPTWRGDACDALWMDVAEPSSIKTSCGEEVSLRGSLGGPEPVRLRGDACHVQVVEGALSLHATGVRELGRVSFFWLDERGARRELPDLGRDRPYTELTASLPLSFSCDD